MKDSSFTDRQSHSTDASYTSPAPDSQSHLTFNIMPFNHPAQTMEFAFSSGENTGKYRFWIEKLPKEASRLIPGFDPQHPFVYTNFDTTSEGTCISIDFNEQRAVARAWYTLKIRDFLSDSANVTVTNFLQDCQFWYCEKDVNNLPYTVYKKFTLRVQTDHRIRKPELLVSFDGKSYVLKKSLAQLNEDATFDTKLLKSVIYRKHAYKYKNMPAEAFYHQDEIFPVIDRSNKVALKVNLPFEINRKKYMYVYSEIDAFFKTHLNSDDFRAVIPHTAQWKPAISTDVHRLNNTGRNMIFGEGHVSGDIYDSMKNNGPFALPAFRHSKIFMICHEEDLAAAKKLEAYIIRQSGFGSLHTFTRMPFEYDKDLDIILSGDKNPVEIIRGTLQNRYLDPGCGYFAFYISPYTRFEPRAEKREIYFKIKEIMLQRGIGLQVIERQKIFTNFGLSIANIGIAMVAKMGGIPWRLSRPAEKELIIGFGAFKSQRYNTKYVGSAFCFSNDGTFQEFNCFPADETWSIAGSAEEALLAYRRNNPDVKRMVIHFYKKIGYKEIKPVEDMLRKLKLDIPIIVVRINKTFSESQLVFDEAFSGKMPLNGSFVHCGRNEYLFCNNQRENAGSNPSALPLPLKIGLQSNDPGVLNDPVLVERLMKQVYEFSFMHWRSVSLQTLPVTVAYPEMLAKLFPWFDNDTLPEEGRKSLFFL